MSTERLTDERLAELVEAHKRSACPSCDGKCNECGHLGVWPNPSWPCETYLLAQELRAARAYVAGEASRSGPNENDVYQAWEAAREH